VQKDGSPSLLHLQKCSKQKLPHQQICWKWGKEKGFSLPQLYNTKPMLIWTKGKSDRFCHSCEKRQFLINPTMKLAAVFEIKGSSGFCPLSFCMDLS
jgi:hypothetical protein